MAPALCREVIDAFRAGDLARFGPSFMRLMQLNATLSRAQNPRSVKAAMNLLGLPAGALRRPYLPLDEAQEHEIGESLAALGLR